MLILRLSSYAGSRPRKAPDREPRLRRVFCGGGLWLPVGSAVCGDDYVLLGCFYGNVAPALALVAGHLNGDEAGGRAAGYATAARRDQVVDVAGDDEQDGALCHFQRRLDAGGVEQPEGNVQGFAEASVVVVVDVPRLYDDADPEPAVPPARIREPGVVAGQKPAENRDDEFEQQLLVCLVDQREQAIAAVGEPVAAARADSRRAQRRIEQLVEHGPELGLDRIGPAGRTFYVQRDHDPAAEWAQRLVADQRREGERLQL